ncbi:hypothetical protein [Cohaesibacter gelatinilyticus]|nr:hypothetical protein [Cohaesibacter gelatinilyticus]
MSNNAARQKSIFREENRWAQSGGFFSKLFGAGSQEAATEKPVLSNDQIAPTSQTGSNTTRQEEQSSRDLDISHKQARQYLSPEEQEYRRDFLENAQEQMGGKTPPKEIFVIRHLLQVMNEKDEDETVRILQKFLNLEPAMIRAGLEDLQSYLQKASTDYDKNKGDRYQSLFEFIPDWQKKNETDPAVLKDQYMVNRPLSNSGSAELAADLNALKKREQLWISQENAEEKARTKNVRVALEQKYGLVAKPVKPGQFVFHYRGKKGVLNQGVIKPHFGNQVEVKKGVFHPDEIIDIPTDEIRRRLGFHADDENFDPQEIRNLILRASKDHKLQSKILNIRGMEPFGHILKDEELSKLTDIPLDKIQKMRSGDLAVSEVEDTLRGVANGSGSLVSDGLQTIARKHKELNIGTQQIEIREDQRKIKSDLSLLLKHSNSSAITAEAETRMSEELWKRMEAKARKETALHEYQKKSIEEHFLYELGTSIDGYIEKNWATNDLLSGGELGKEAGKALIELIVVSGANALTGGAGAALMTYMVTYSDKSQALYEFARKEGYDEERAQRISNYAALTALPAAIPLSKIKNFKPVADLLNKMSANNAIRTKLMSFASDILVSAGEGAAQEYFAELLNQFPENAIYPNPGDEDQFRWWSDKMKAAFMKGIQTGALNGLAGTASPSPK